MHLRRDWPFIPAAVAAMVIGWLWGGSTISQSTAELASYVVIALLGLWMVVSDWDPRKPPKSKRRADA